MECLGEEEVLGRNVSEPIARLICFNFVHFEFILRGTKKILSKRKEIKIGLVVIFFLNSDLSLQGV